MRNLTMLSRVVGANGKTAGITLVDQNGVFVNTDVNGIAGALNNREINLLNVGICNGEVVGTNGKIDRYTTFSAGTGTIVGKVHPVIINKAVNKEGKALGFTIFNTEGMIKTVSASLAVEIGKRAEYANAKIVNKDGVDIVSSISGNFTTHVIDNEETKETFEKVFAGSSIKPILVSKACNSNMKKMSETFVSMIVTVNNAKAFNELMDIVTKSNREVRKHVEMVSKLSSESLEIQRMDSNMVYVTVDVDTAYKLMSINGVSSSVTGKLLVCYVEYKTGAPEEHLVVVTNGWSRDKSSNEPITEKILAKFKDRFETLIKWQ